MQLNKLKLLILIVITINSYSQVGPKYFHFNAKIKIINQCEKEIKFKINDSLNFFSKENNLKLSFHQIWMNSYDEQFYDIEKIKLNKNKFNLNLYDTGILELKEETNFNISIEKFFIEQKQKGNNISLIMIELIKETKKMFVFFDFTKHISDTKIKFPIIFKEGTYKVNDTKGQKLIEIKSTEFNSYMNKK